MRISDVVHTHNNNFNIFYILLVVYYRISSICCRPRIPIMIYDDKFTELVTHLAPEGQ